MAKLFTRLSILGMVKRKLGCIAFGHPRTHYLPVPTPLQVKHYEEHFGKPHWQEGHGWCTWCAELLGVKPRFRK